MKLICSDPSLGGFGCGWFGDESDVLTAPNPFIQGGVLQACPRCKDMTLVSCCDEPGCDQPVTCGTQTDTEYRHTCHKHKP